MNKDKVLEAVVKLRGTAQQAVKNGYPELALEAIAAAALSLFKYNQSYQDYGLEGILDECVCFLSPIGFEQNDVNEDTVLFYDTFGDDIRGLALIYLIALTDMGFHVIYVTEKSMVANQVNINKKMQNCSFTRGYIDRCHKRYSQAQQLQKLFEKYKPSKAFFYSMPDDVSGAIVFQKYSGLIERYLINLTDHAFWIGKNSFDYCIEFRNWGANVSSIARGIPNDRLIIQPYYPYVDYEIEFSGLPFDWEKRKWIFSGGSLYKTMDKEGKYYLFLETVLRTLPEIYFLYAGTGNDCKLKELMKKFPNRVYFVNERKDLAQIMKRCTVYLNTYPLSGGLMTQYAAKEGKIPLTLMTDGLVHSGILLDENSRHFLYTSYDDMLKDTIKLLSDDEYLQEREALIYGSIISEKKFTENLKLIMNKHKSKYKVNIIENFDIYELREQYVQRWNFKRDMSSAIGNGRNKYLFFKYTKYFIWNFIRKITRRSHVICR